MAEAAAPAPAVVVTTVAAESPPPSDGLRFDPERPFRRDFFAGDSEEAPFVVAAAAAAAASTAVAVVVAAGFDLGDIPQSFFAVSLGVRIRRDRLEEFGVVSADAAAAEFSDKAGGGGGDDGPLSLDDPCCLDLKASFFITRAPMVPKPSLSMRASLASVGSHLVRSPVKVEAMVIPTANARRG